MRVIFNIKKLQFQKITALSDVGVPTYGSVIRLPGTVSLTLDGEQTSDSFYADGIVYYSPTGATSYSGTLENALFSEEALKQIYNYIEDNNGNLLETDDAPSEFGMQFACDSDDGEVYFTYYRVSSNKPGLNLKTNESSATINPQSVSLKASSITLEDGMTQVVRAYATKNSPNYSTFMNGIVIPVKKTV